VLRRLTAPLPAGARLELRRTHVATPWLEQQWATAPSASVGLPTPLVVLDGDAAVQALASDAAGGDAVLAGLSNVRREFAGG
jgi:hypothetical protein